jgi:hypothetical protein
VNPKLSLRVMGLDMISSFETTGDGNHDSAFLQPSAQHLLKTIFAERSQF